MIYDLIQPVLAANIRSVVKTLRNRHTTASFTVKSLSVLRRVTHHAEHEISVMMLMILVCGRQPYRRTTNRLCCMSRLLVTRHASTEEKRLLFCFIG